MQAHPGTLDPMTIEEQIALMRRATVEIISEDDLKAKLQKGKPLRVKLGVDPTVAHVTLGWAVVLRKLRDFQRLGHTACLIIGDFTSMIGDPSGKSKTRPQLSREEVERNVAAVSEQVYKILDPARTEIYYNKDWLGKMTFEDVIRLTSKYTVARILERDDFTNRLNENKPVSMHEILYPLCQGYDSVAIEADVELGGNDQKFNNLVGRNLMQQFNLEPQVVILSPLLVGTDGKEKMSQSLGNYISVVDTPDDMFGKTMSIPDELIENWFELCTDVPMDEIKQLVRSMTAGEANPRDVKRRLAREIISLYHSPEAAAASDEEFLRRFSQKQLPTEIEEVAVPAEMWTDGALSLPGFMVHLGLAKSNGQAKDLMKAGAVTLDDVKITDSQARLAPDQLVGRVLKVGKLNYRRITG